MSAGPHTCCTTDPTCRLRRPRHRPRRQRRLSRHRRAGTSSSATVASRKGRSTSAAAGTAIPGASPIPTHPSGPTRAWMIGGGSSGENPTVPSPNMRIGGRSLWSARSSTGGISSESRKISSSSALLRISKARSSRTWPAHAASCSAPSAMSHRSARQCTWPQSWS